MVTKRKYIGYGITNNKGIATLDYDANGDSISPSGFLGNGRGLINLEAEMHDDNSVVTEPYNVWDTLVYDEGLEAEGHHNDVWSGYQSGATLTRTPTHSVLKETGSGNVIARLTIDGIAYDFSEEYGIEFDLKQVDGAYNGQIIDLRNRLDGTQPSFVTFSHLGVYDRDWHHIRITSLSTGITVQADNNNPYTATRYPHHIFGLWTGSDMTELHFKNFKVYISDTLNVEDIQWFDLALDNTKELSWFIDTTNTSVSYNGNGRTVTKTENTSTWRYFYYNTNALSSVLVGNRYSIPTGNVIEFEITAITGSVVFDVMDNLSNHMDNKGATAIGKYKIVLDGTDCKMYKDDATTPYATGTMNGSNVRFGFVFNAYNESITYKDFKIYPI